MSFGLKEVHLEEIKTIFAKFNSITKVILYGSRAKEIGRASCRERV